VCDLPDGSRAYARMEESDRLAEVEATEWVGTEVRLRAGDGGRNLVEA
jgi:hypothetical protein